MITKCRVLDISLFDSSHTSFLQPRQMHIYRLANHTQSAALANVQENPIYQQYLQAVNISLFFQSSSTACGRLALQVHPFVAGSNKDSQARARNGNGIRYLQAIHVRVQNSRNGFWGK